MNKLFELYLDLGAEIRDLSLGSEPELVKDQIRLLLLKIEQELVKSVS